MNEEREDYVLGRNVTEQARAKERRGTVVLSLRVSGHEFDALTDFADSEGRTVSQVARAAIQQWLAHPHRASHSASMSFPSGGMAYFGDVRLGTAGTGGATHRRDSEAVASHWVLSA
jgi:hypothetical protein